MVFVEASALVFMVFWLCFLGLYVNLSMSFLVLVFLLRKFLVFLDGSPSMTLGSQGLKCTEVAAVIGYVW